MAFFDELGKKITETGQGVVKKTKDTAEIVKLKGMVSDEEKKINSTYKEIGKLYYEKYSNQSENEFETLTETITEAKNKISNYSEVITKLKGFVNCPNCGKEVAYDAVFCSSCGFSMNKANTESTLKCHNCNAPIGVGDSFCVQCGTPVTKAEQNSNNRSCNKCGATISPEMLFCEECGNKL